MSTTPNAPKAFPWLRHLLADGGYTGSKLKSALTKLDDWTLETVNRSDRTEGFEKTIASAEAWIIIAHIRLVSRRIARHCFFI